MTETTTSTASDQPNEAGVLEHLDLTVLVIESNVRTEGLVLDPEFVDSVRTHGVLVPVLGWRDSDGAVRVRAGQRRTLAARQRAWRRSRCMSSRPTTAPRGRSWSSRSKTSTGST